MDILESRIGHRFTDVGLLRLALRHPGLATRDQGAGHDNQRLEFLGDAVLHLVLTEWIYREEPDLDEGRMTAVRACLAARPSLVRAARVLGLEEFLIADKPLRKGPSAGMDSALADAFEAVVGALFLDGGIEAATMFLQRELAADMAAATREPGAANPKGRLLELLQAISTEQPVYRVDSEQGPDHARSFEVVVSWRDLDLGRGVGGSKKAAEIAAARAALETRRWEDAAG